MLWAQSSTQDYIRAEHKLHSISKLSIHKSSFYKSVCFFAYLYSAGTQHGNLPPAGWSILFCGLTQEPCVSHSQHRKNRERFWKKCRWIDRKGRNKEGSCTREGTTTGLSFAKALFCRCEDPLIYKSFTDSILSFSFICWYKSLSIKIKTAYKIESIRYWTDWSMQANK